MCYNDSMNNKQQGEQMDTMNPYTQHNIQLIQFTDGSYFITARTDARTQAEIERNAGWQAESRARDPGLDPLGMKWPMAVILQTRTIQRVINVEGLQGLSKATALASKAALIKGLRSMGHTVLNKNGGEE